MAMYNPEPFQVHDHEAALAFVERNDFAIIVSHGQLQATHTPMDVVRHTDRLELFGHFSRKNPHCELLDGSTRHTCIFAGPHTYVSPSWYENSPAVPTWNYSAVHITGTATEITEPVELHERLFAMTSKHDPQLDAPQQMPNKFMRGMMKGITGFMLSIDEIEFKQKLSQFYRSTNTGPV
ncbi:MAG: FMN-binding negative transcriptional regulator [Pseudomonadota bacterium]